MAEGSRRTSRTNATTRRRARRCRPVSAWLGVGALTVGVGAALASGSAAEAHADPGSLGRNTTTAPGAKPRPNSSTVATVTKKPPTSLGVPGDAPATAATKSITPAEPASPAGSSFTKNVSPITGFGAKAAVNLNRSRVASTNVQSTPSPTPSNTTLSGTGGRPTPATRALLSILGDTVNYAEREIGSAVANLTSPSRAQTSTSASSVRTASVAGPAITSPANTVIATIPVAYPRSVVVSPNGNRAYIASANGDVTVIDTATNAKVATIRTYGTDPTSLLLSPDGSRVYVLSNTRSGGLTIPGAPIYKEVSVISTATDAVVGRIVVSDDPVDAVASPDGSRLYILGKNGSIEAIDTTTDRRVGGFSVVGNPVNLAVTPNGGYVYAPETRFETVAVINTATDSYAAIGVGNYPRNVVVNPAGSVVYVLNSNFWNGGYYGGGSVSVINTATNTSVATVPVGVYPTNLVVSPNGSSVYVVNEVTSSVSIIDAATNKVVATVPVGAYPTDLVVSPDGSRVYVTNSRADTVSVIDTATDAVIATVPVGASPTDVVVSPDGSRVYVTNSRGDSVSVIDTATDITT